MGLEKTVVKMLTIADGISLSNALFGFFSILLISIGEIRLGVSLIFLALLIDGVDGIVARRTKIGVLGEYFEAMADITSLGLAPAFLVFTIFFNEVNYCIYCQIYLIGALVVFLSSGIIRLASFHIMKDKKKFIGLPASASTIILIVSLVFLKFDFFIILIILIILGVLMCCRIRFPKPDIKINIVAAVLILLTIIFWDYFSSIIPILLLLSIALYSIIGPIFSKKMDKNISKH